MIGAAYPIRARVCLVRACAFPRADRESTFFFEIFAVFEQLAGRHFVSAELNRLKFSCCLCSIVIIWFLHYLFPLIHNNL